MSVVNKVTKIHDYLLFGSGYSKSHSYRIPSLLKLISGKLISVVDQRLDNAMDVPWTTINQFIRTSIDNGQTWSDGHPILKIECLNDSLVGAIDSCIVEDQVTKDIFLIVDVFPAGSGIIKTTADMNPLSEKELGYTPDKKYLKLFKLNSDQKFILKKIKHQKKNQNWMQAYELIDNDFYNTSDTNLRSTKIFVDNSYYPETKLLKGSVYENVTDYNQITVDPVCSIFDGFDNRNPNWKKPKYYIDSTPYIYMFKSSNEGDDWELVQIFNQILIPDNQTRALVVGPGKGLQLRKQKKPINNRLIFPIYTVVDYEIPGYFYAAYSDDHGESWHIGNFANLKINNSRWKWMSESQLIEDSFGQIWAFMRQELADHYSLSKSLDGGQNWQTVDNQRGSFSDFYKKDLNSTIMYGLAHFNHNNHDYSLVSLPTTVDRKNGELFLMDLKHPEQLTSIYHFGAKGDTFGYSTIEVLKQKNDELLIGVLYEVSQTRNKTLAWIGFDEAKNDYSHATEMVYELIKIKLN